MSEQVKPYSPEAAKKDQVADMFDNIAHSYDFLNHFFSLGIDNIWRKKAVRMMKKDSPEKVMDMVSYSLLVLLSTRWILERCVWE